MADNEDAPLIREDDARGGARLDETKDRYGTRAHVPTLPGPEPIGPEVLPIRALHRHDDGVITFHRKDLTGDFRNLFGIRGEHLEGMFPDYQEQLEQDAYFSVNAFWHREKHRHCFNATEVRQPNRLRYLCANYVDLDIYRLDINFSSALGTVIDYQDKGLLPPASLIVRSGRGLWLLWFLHDAKNPARPPGAFPEKLKLYTEINRAAGERLAEFGADAAARDALRLTRVPGSIHSGAANAHRRVKYWIQSALGGQAVTYTLDELANAFGVELRLDLATRRAFKESALPPGNHLRGHKALNSRRLREFDLLRSMRGGFVQGHRSNAALLYATLLCRSGMSHQAVLQQVEALGRECRPPLNPSSCRQAAKTAFARKVSRVRDQTIADWLDVTPREAEYLERLPPASSFRPVNTLLIAPPIKAEQRRSLIKQLIERHGSIPSCGQMALLLAEAGHSVSRQQVYLDYRALNLERPVNRPLPAQRSLFIKSDMGTKLRS